MPSTTAAPSEPVQVDEHPTVDRNLLRRAALERLAKELAAQRLHRDGFIAEAQMTGQLEQQVRESWIRRT